MNKRDIFKTAASFAGGIAVSGLMTMLIKSNAVPTNTKEKIFVSLGGFILGSMVSDKASDYIEDTCDKVFGIFDNLKPIEVAEEVNNG